MKHFLFITLLLIFSNVVSGQAKFRIKAVEGKNWKSTYYIVDEKGKAIKELDTAKYIISMNSDDYKYFAVFFMKNEQGWKAIDINENILFEVYNTSFGEPTPDELVENKIRIIDSNNKIGFANEKGKIIITPRFEIASSFYKGKAIIGESCDKIPWDENAHEGDCHHYSIVCTKHGYINDKGQIVELGNFSYEDIIKKIKWKSPYE